MTLCFSANYRCKNPFWHPKDPIAAQGLCKRGGNALYYLGLFEVSNYRGNRKRLDRKSRDSGPLSVELCWNNCLLLRHGFHSATHLPETSCYAHRSAPPTSSEAAKGPCQGVFWAAAKGGVTNGGLRGVWAALPGNRPKSAFFALFLPFLPFSGGCEEHLRNPENGGKRPFSSDILRFA